jgi:endonuclease/exonuclease/phosphatase family metal-dependent hydrolase
VRVVSLNCWGGRLHNALAPWLRGVDADVLCLQEVTRTEAPDSEWLTYRDGDHVLAQRTNLFDEIATALPGHDGSFFPAARGVLHRDDGSEVVSCFGLATFASKSLPVISEAMEFVHGAFSAEGWGAHPRARNAHAFRIVDERGRTATIAHMHGLRDVAGKHDTPARATQAERLAALVKRVAQEGDRLIVCGDFNVLPGSATFDILGRLGLVDLVTSRGHTSTRTSHYTKAERFADYMLVSGNVEVANFEPVASPEVSDHRPLVLDVGQG